MNNQEYQVRDMLILDEDRKKQIKIGKDTFVILAPFPKDQRDIARQLAIEYDGLPINSFSIDDRYMFTRDITLDILIEDSPKWWTKAVNCPDYELKDFLYSEILKWSEEFQEKLKKNKLVRRGKEASE